MIMRTFLFCVFFLTGGGVFAGEVNASSSTLTVKDVYKPALTRDPLLVSNFFGDDKKWSAEKPRVSTAAFSAANLELTGIMEDKSGRQAILRDRVAGETYFLKAGRLFDSERKEVKGIGGIARSGEVFIVTGDRKVYHISLKQ